MVQKSIDSDIFEIDHALPKTLFNFPKHKHFLRGLNYITIRVGYLDFGTRSLLLQGLAKVTEWHNSSANSFIMMETKFSIGLPLCLL